MYEGHMKLILAEQAIVCLQGNPETPGALLEGRQYATPTALCAKRFSW